MNNENILHTPRYLVEEILGIKIDFYKHHTDAITAHLYTDGDMPHEPNDLRKIAIALIETAKEMEETGEQQ